MGKYVSFADSCIPNYVPMFSVLLVLAVKLPELLAYVSIEEETLLRLQQKLIDFLKYALFP